MEDMYRNDFENLGVTVSKYLERLGFATADGLRYVQKLDSGETATMYRAEAGTDFLEPLGLVDTDSLDLDRTWVLSLSTEAYESTYTGGVFECLDFACVPTVGRP